MTGTGGGYRYHKCNTPIGKGNVLCDHLAVLIDKRDTGVLNTLADRVLAKHRVKRTLADSTCQIKSVHANDGQESKALWRQLDELQTATIRWMETVEKGLLLDAMLLQRSAHSACDGRKSC